MVTRISPSTLIDRRRYVSWGSVEVGGTYVMHLSPVDTTMVAVHTDTMPVEFSVLLIRADRM